MLALNYKTQYLRFLMDYPKPGDFSWKDCRIQDRWDGRRFMNIMYAADDNYAEIMGVSVKSLIENNPDEDLRFYIITDGIDENNVNHIREMIETSGNKAEFIPKPDIHSLVGVDLKTLRWSDSAYSRLFLQEIFGVNPEIDKVIYLDCDTLIVGPLKRLWDTDIEDYLGAACLECMSNMHKYIIGAKKNDNYINTGMIYFNVKKWIQDDIQAKCVAMIQEYNGRTEYVDQGVINGTVSNQFKLVSPRYNLTALAYDFSYEDMQVYRKPQFGYSIREWEEAVKDPVVIHFTTSFLSIRPWYEGSRHPYAEYWWEVHERTPWKGAPYREMKNRESRSRKERVYRMIPGKIGVRIAGILHSYVKPMSYMLANRIWNVQLLLGVHGVRSAIRTPDR